jgi:hypothetical protein
MSERMRRFHRLVSMVFMATVVFTAVALTVDSSVVWVSYVPLLPLFVLMITGITMWFRPRRKASTRPACRAT